MKIVLNRSATPILEEHEILQRLETPVIAKEGQIESAVAIQSNNAVACLRVIVRNHAEDVGVMRALERRNVVNVLKMKTVLRVVGGCTSSSPTECVVPRSSMHFMRPIEPTR